MTRVRNYRREYDTYHAKEKQKKNRAKRNAARNKLAKTGRVSRGDGKEVDHKRPLSRGGGNGRSNLRVTSRRANRRKGTRS
jgi:5-methylcytosine-specific restriction endonuclease McrA